MQDRLTFWNFSLKFYARPGVSDICVDLQDHYGVDVNVLLYLLWQASRGGTLTKDEIERLISLTRDWQSNVVHPLRTVRRFLKEPGPTWSSPEVASLRQRVKNEELLAEHLQQDAMEAAFPPPDVIGDIREFARTNCETYGHILNFNFPARHLSAILDHLAD